MSTNTPCGVPRPVWGPFRTRKGATLPLSVAWKTRISSVTELATNSSPRSASREMCTGQSSRVRGPRIIRNGGVSPLALRGYTVIDGGKNAPEPGTRYFHLSESGVHSTVGAPGLTSRAHPPSLVLLLVGPWLATYIN